MSKKKTVENAEKIEVKIPAPAFQTAVFLISGTTPYVQNKFSAKAREMITSKQKAGSTSAKEKKRLPKDFQASYEAAMHRSAEGWNGIPAPAFRNAMISACRLVEFTMTLAKLCVWIEQDGIDADDGTPLVRITKGEPRYSEMSVKIERNKTDIRPRPMWEPGWEAIVRVTYDSAQFTATDITHLMMRVGMQVGIGEGRPDSKSSNGLGWGLFSIVADEEEQAA